MPQVSKFQGIDFSAQEVLPLTLDLESLGQGFRCLRSEFVTYWKRGKIKRECDSHTSRCWVMHCEGSLASYITLLADKLTLTEPILQGENIQYQTFPAVKIGYLAADLRAKKAGKRLILWAVDYAAGTIAPLLGVRFITVDAFYDRDTTDNKNYDASGYYKALGFRYVNPEEEFTAPEDKDASYKTMYLDIKPLIDHYRKLGNEGLHNVLS